MSSRNTQRHTYPLEAWCLTETVFDTGSHFLDETLFTLGNGYIGLRGTHEEGYSGPTGTSLDGTYLNGFHESEPIRYPETAYGLAKKNEFMLNVPNGKCIELWVENERFDLLQGIVLNYERSLDFRTGLLSRSVEWISPQGHRLAITSQRMVCFQHKNLFAIQYHVKPLNFSGRILLVSALDGATKNVEAGDDPRVGSATSGSALHLIATEQTGDFSALTHRTHNSGFTLVSAIENVAMYAGTTLRTSSKNQQRLGHGYEAYVTEGNMFSLTKFGVYFSSRDYPEDKLMAHARYALNNAKATGFESLCADQEAYLSDFWRQTDVEIAGDPALQQGIHFNQFHLLQSVGRDGKTNIAAKGVTGEGYEGHYFWDTEIYILPYFVYNKPEIAKKLLEYRYGGLSKARERARQMSHAKGALYPWRTITGEECSSYFPAGTAQYHLNADIAYSIKLYLDATGDESFLLNQGAEIVMETARIWMGIGNYADKNGQHFCINEVTGPDEYSALVNNNYYTNAMAQMHLQFAADIATKIKENHPDEFSRIVRLIDLENDEITKWRHAAEHMYLPYDEERKIHQQDDSFLSRKVWDFAGTPKDKYPLLLHYHPLVIYRHQVCKQADVVLALLLLSEKFSLEDKKRDFDYYEAVTTHDSSLSTCIFSIIASEIGYHEKAYDYFMETARLDLDDTHGNTCHGVHTAAMAGTWLGVAYGFAGMRICDNQLRFAPTLPKQWQYYQFKIHIKGHLLQVHVGVDKVEYRLLEGECIEFKHREHSIRLTQSASIQTVEHNSSKTQDMERRVHG